MDTPTEKNKALAREVLEKVFNQHDLTAAARYYREDYRQHNPNVPQGRAGFQQFFGAFMSAFPDLHADVEHLMAEGDQVVLFIRWTGTHLGDFQGLAPTGRRIEFQTADVFRIVEGLIAEHWDVVANTDMLAALGVIRFEGGAKRM
ncbi:MAG TPA: ester cyclase [Polyangia bacterium]|jgi:predicted SnoaL-like aldol condensation-catalyzing enzyme|nr:ester cyclase [Polyangia bacterium]